MEQSHNIESGYDSLNKILLFMEYDLSKTYSENLKVLKEQKPDEMMPFQIEKFGYNPNKPNTLQPAVQKQQQSIKEMTKFFEENRHGVLQVAALGALLIPFVGPFVSLGLELSDASLYYKEGDKYMAGLTLAFATIPASQLLLRIPAVKKITKQSLVKIVKFMEFGPKSKIVLSQTEKEAAEQIAKNSKWIKYTAALNLVKSSFSKLLQKLSLRNFIKFMMKWKNNNKIKYAIGHGLIQISGIWYTYDKLAEMFGISPKGEDIQPKASVKKRQQLEKSFEETKPKTQKEVVDNIEKNLTDETSLIELQKLMNESLSQDTMSNVNQTPSVTDTSNHKPFNNTPGAVSEPKKSVTPPIQLKDEDGVKLFQDWLDENAPGWATGYKDGILNKGQNGGGYGRFGPRTQKAWSKYKDQYLQIEQI